jgi:hypothetical protein
MCVSNACDAYSDTWNNHYDIYMIFWGTIYVIINKKLVLAPLPCVKTMAHGKDIFAVCKNYGTRQRFELCRMQC